MPGTSPKGLLKAWVPCRQIYGSSGRHRVYHIRLVAAGTTLQAEYGIGFKNLAANATPSVEEPEFIHSAIAFAPGGPYRLG